MSDGSLNSLGSLTSGTTIGNLLGQDKYPDTYFIPEPELANIPIVHLDATLEKDTAAGNAGVLGSGAGTLLTGNGAAGGAGLMSKYNLHVEGSPDADHLQATYASGSVGSAKGVGFAPSATITHTLGDYLSHDISGHSTVHPSGAGVWFDTLDDAVYAVKLYIEQQMLVIKNLDDPKLKSLLYLAEHGHAASCAQILKENYMLGKHKIDIFQKYDMGPMGVLAFAQSLPSYGTDLGYGRMAEFLERVASDDLYGDAIKATLRQSKNAMLLSDLGVNTEVFNLPHSAYYRDPAEMYRQAYTGSLPLVPMFQSDQVIPQTDADIYLNDRNQTLIDNGYNPYVLLPAQADEIYMDLKANKADDSVKESLGLSIVKQAVNRNLRVVGDQLKVVGLNGSMYTVAMIRGNGLELTDASLLLDTMLGVVNKLLYGNIGATKYDNPYMTDQMLYGMMEMLGQIDGENIDALKQTLLGQFALPDLLDKIKGIIAAISGKLKTGIDRNDPVVWGDSGAGAETKLI